MYDHVSTAMPGAAAVAGMDACLEPMSNPDMAVLSLADPAIDSRVVLFIPGALELACGLLRSGVSEVTMVRPDAPHCVGEADIAVVPQVPSAGFLCAAIRCARTVLAPLGTLTVRLDQGGPGDLSTDLLALACQQLRLHGFTAIRSHSLLGATLLRAELPLCGRLACA